MKGKAILRRSGALSEVSVLAACPELGPGKLVITTWFLRALMHSISSPAPLGTVLGITAVHRFGRFSDLVQIDE